jgi:hypothetical protein
VSEQTLTPEQRAELARLASEADLPWRAKGHWVHSNADVVAMAEDSEQGGRDVQFIVAACNAVPQLLADLAAAEQERDKALYWEREAQKTLGLMRDERELAALREQIAVLEHALQEKMPNTYDRGLIYEHAKADKAQSERDELAMDALRARVAELDAMLPSEEGDHA